MQRALHTFIVHRTRGVYAIARTLGRLIPPLPLAGFGFAVVLLVTGAVVGHGYVASIRADAAMLVREQQALDQLNAVERALGEALGAFRAFVISPTDGNARLYEAAQERSRYAVDSLRYVAAANVAIDPAVTKLAAAHVLSLQGAMILVSAGRGDTDLPTLSMLAVADALERERARVQESATGRSARMAGQLQQADAANVLSAATSLTLLLVFGWLMTEFLRQRNRVAKALRDVNANLEQTVASRTAQLAELSQHLMKVREDERAALAREIHDQLGSELSTVIIDSSRVETLVRSGRAVPETVWARLKATLQEMTTAHRRIINALHPSVLDHLGLAAALAALLRDVRERAGIATDLVVEGDLEGLPDGLPIAVYRIVQEAASNVVRHAQAQTVLAHVTRTQDTLRVDIIDDGIGMQGQSPAKGRLGLVGMRERAHNLGGTFRVGPGPGNHGTCVTAVFPAPRARSSDDH